MPSDTHTQALHSAWASIKNDVSVSYSEGQSRTGDAQIALIEPGIRLLELAAAYREAHATFEAALEGEHMEPLRAMEAVQNALLSAALDIR
jgi:hypothetical protein